MKNLEIIGNVGRNAERVSAATGKELMRFSVAATNRDGSTLWISVLCNYREGVFPYIVKGKQVFVSGGFDFRVFNGVATVDLFADRIELLGKKEEPERGQVGESVTIPQNEPPKEPTF